MSSICHTWVASNLYYLVYFGTFSPEIAILRKQEHTDIENNVLI